MASSSGNRLRGSWHQIITYCFVAVGLIMLVEASRGGSLSFIGYGTSVTVWDDVYRLKIRRHDDWLTAKLEGEIAFTADENDLAQLSPGAYLEIEERRHGKRWRLEATPGADGEPAMVWQVRGRSVPFDADGRAWLSRTLPRVLRATGYDAEGRVARLLARGGVDRVLDEIKAIRGDSAQRNYADLLRQQAQLDTAQLERLLDTVGRMMASDATLGELLADVAPEALVLKRPAFEGPAFEGSALEGPAPEESVCEGLCRAFFVATKSIASDSELRRTLEAALAVEALPYATYDALLNVALSIASDAELAELLMAVSRRVPSDQPLPPRFADPLSTIASDSEQRRVLSAVVAERPLDDDLVAGLLTAALTIASDAELAGFLAELAATYPISEDLRPAWERALDTVASREERARVEAAGPG